MAGVRVQPWWRLSTRSTRNALSEEERATLGAALLATAEKVGADPEVLIAFSTRSPEPVADTPDREAAAA